MMCSYLPPAPSSIFICASALCHIRHFVRTFARRELKALVSPLQELPLQMDHLRVGAYKKLNTILKIQPKKDKNA